MMDIPTQAQTLVFPSYFEDFENGDGGWTASGTNSSWQLGTPSNNVKSAYSGENAWTTNLGGNYNTNELSYLTSPQFDFSCMSEDPVLQFAHAYWLEDEWDFYWVEISIDGGAWTKLGSEGSGTNWYQRWLNRVIRAEEDLFGGNGKYSKDWDVSSHVLTGAAGSSDVRIRFVLSSDTSTEYDGVNIDDIRIDAVSLAVSPVALTTPTNSTTGHPLNITLNWDAHNCADSYEIEVSTTDDFSNVIVSDALLTTNTYDIAGLEYETQYFWRVRAVKDGNPGVWAAPFDFTTKIAPPTAPIQILPTDATINVHPAALALIWQSQTRASSYRVQLATDPDFTNIIKDESVTGGAIDVSGLLVYGTQYYWRLSASNSTGTSAWSSVWMFTTLLPTPTLSMPINNEQSLNVPVQFTWQTLPGVTTYDLQIATDAAFSSIVFDGAVNGNTYSANDLEIDTRYFWRVRAIGSGGIMSDYTEARNMSTIVPAPKLSLPFSGSLDIETAAELVWNANQKPAKYQVQVSTVSDFKTTAIDKTIDGTTLAVNGLVNNQYYYWRVRAVTTDKGNSSWSDPYTFVTIVAPTANISPANNTKKVLYPVTLEWKSVGKDIKYDVEIASDKNFSNIVVKDVVTNANAKEFSSYEGLDSYQTYWWRVRPHAQTNKSIEWSQPYVFTSSIGQAKVVFPENNSTEQSTYTRFRWSTVHGAESYTIVVSKKADFSDTVAIMRNMTLTNFLPTTELELSTKYYWYVIATSTDDGTTTSKTWSFTTAAAKLAETPQLIAPENAAVLPTGTVELKWETVANALSYDVEVSTDMNFGTILFDGKGQTASSWAIDANAAEQTLYWRVRSVNGAGVSPWSNARRFSTAAEALAAPSLVSPPQNAVKVEPTVILSWMNVVKATSFRVEVSVDENFSQLVYEKGKIVGQSTLPIQLGVNTKYYWRVASENDNGVSAWSPTWNFTTSVVSSVADDPSANGVVVMPQPVSDVMTLNLGTTWENGFTFRLYNVNGVLVMSNDYSSASLITIPTEGLLSGTYMIQVSNERNTVTLPVVITK